MSWAIDVKLPGGYMLVLNKDGSVDAERTSVGTVIDKRSDGSYVYMSMDGVKNLDDMIELLDAIEEDKQREGTLAMYECLL